MAGRFRLAFSANAYLEGGRSFEEAADKIAFYGYEGVEVIADRPHAFPPDLDEERIDALKGLVEMKNLKVSNVNSNTVFALYGDRYEPSFISWDQAWRRARIDYTKQCIDLADTLGSNTLCVLSGESVSSGRPREAQKWLISGLLECIDYIRSNNKGVTLCIEHHPAHFVERSADLEWLLDEIHSQADPRYFGINFDIVHIETMRESIYDNILKFNKNIRHFHIADCELHKHYHLIPGQGGDIDFGRLAQVLDTIDYSDFLTVELYTYRHEPNRAAREAKIMLDRLLRC